MIEEVVNMFKTFNNELKKCCDIILTMDEDSTLEQPVFNVPSAFEN